MKELRVYWEITIDDARANNNDMLKRAYVYGDMNVLEELRQNWHMTTEDAVASLGVICKSLHIELILQELRTTWNVTPIHLREYYDKLVGIACYTNRLSLLLELRTHWK